MNQIDYFFLDLGLSWSLAKAFPYALCILLGVGLFYFLKKIKLQKYWLNVTIRLVAFITPFLIYFSFFPIYEGDFINQGSQPKSTVQFPTKKSLTIVVLPNCPYCYQSIVLMKKIKERHPTVSINYWVSSLDTLPSNTAILRVLPKDFNVTQRYDTDKISELVQGTYPCFILSDNGKAIKLWNNNQVGVSALDEMEDFFQ
ncbi:MAG: hypothetical protein ACKO7D_08330 [Bacteroidota bacterium]